ncbi:MAG: epimerase [Acidobacteria bacterium]|nr:MAG: epimerase [Acidobacteriota bacterium]
MNVFITGGTGYIGSRVIPALIEGGHTVRALIRPGSEKKLPQGVWPILGNALDASTFARYIAPSDTFIQLVGVAHPSPSKADEFQKIDLVSIRESVKAVEASTIRHFIYLSVAHPAPAMKAYVAVREEGERLVRNTAIPATFVRPWYVLGPGHWWPYAVLPMYWIWGAFPSQRETARRLYPVKLAQVVSAIVDAVERPPADVRVIEAPELQSRHVAAAPSPSIQLR